MAEKKIIAVMGATGAQGGGLARAILADNGSEFAVRAITRKPDSDMARRLADAGADVVVADMDDQDSLEKAFAGVYGAFCVTNFWEHFSARKEGEQATAMARATKQAGVEHVIWSTLEDTRLRIPLDDNRLPTLQGEYKVPHFDGKGAVDHVFESEAAPTTFLMAAFYWENFIYFGMGPRKGDDGNMVLAMPLGGVKLPGIAAEDIGKCAYGVFRRGTDMVRQRVGIAGEILSGAEMAAKFTTALGQRVNFYDVPFDDYRAMGFPGAEDLGNMFQYQAILGEEFLTSRNPELSRSLNPELLSFDSWLAANGKHIPLE
ncbi:NmrA/HSCARG family protein [Sedimenticola hydrogenitrophicus]|uniref:NmrA/HSCARG family protein n=1 Tax=Sedimenticola hydrogenitrophicus TaxID=2967975 RepID=UPI0023B160E0|nr:NmrA/HSCARG family protein [Sedimenticola hydrogenitrophicus]